MDLIRLLQDGAEFGAYTLGAFLVVAGAGYLFWYREAVNEKIDEYERYTRHIPLALAVALVLLTVPWLYRSFVDLTPQLRAELLLATALMTAVWMFFDFAHQFWSMRSQHRRYAPSKWNVMMHQTWNRVVFVVVSASFLLVMGIIFEGVTPYVYLTSAAAVSLIILISSACASWQEVTALGKIWTRYEQAYPKTTVFVTVCLLLLAAIVVVDVYAYSVTALVLLVVVAAGYALWLVWHGERKDALEKQYAYTAGAIAKEFETLLADAYSIDLHLHETIHEERRVEMVVELFSPEVRARIENWLLNDIREVLDLSTIEVADYPPELLEEPEGRVVVYVRAVYRV